MFVVLVDGRSVIIVIGSVISVLIKVLDTPVSSEIEIIDDVLAVYKSVVTELVWLVDDTSTVPLVGIVVNPSVISVVGIAVSTSAPSLVKVIFDTSVVSG